MVLCACSSRVFGIFPIREQVRVAQQNRVEALLLEGLDRGEAIVATDDWWEQKRNQLVEQFQQLDG
jgi:antitoxin ParD1/3/4